MRTTIRRIALCIQGALLLAGCAMLQKDEPLALKVAPAQTVRHGAVRAEAQYALGRYYRGQARYGQAVAAFRDALQANPEHAEVRDALGVILASQGRHEEAIAELEKAVASAPRSVSIRNNLGYAYRLHGRNAEAVATLEMAAALDPASVRVRDNLQMAREGAAGDEKIARLAPAKPEVVQASVAPANSAQESVVQERVAVALPPSATPPAAPLAAVTPAVPLPVAAVPPPARSESESEALRPAASGVPAPQPSSPAAVNEVVAQAPAQVSLPPPAVVSTVVSAEKKARLEVSNGNGVNGMAQATARQFQDEGYARPRLTNEQGFRLDSTEIQYRPGFEQQARALQALLRPGVPMSESPRLRFDVQVRLALGKDVKSVAALVVAQQTPLRVAAAQ